MSTQANQSDPVRVVGVDGCRGGWAAVVLDDGNFAGATVNTTLVAILQQHSLASVIAIDMPLGLMDVGWRDADSAAAQQLGHRHSSVFRVPPRPVWQESSYQAAAARCRQLTGAAPSQQAWGLRAKLLEANAIYDQDDGRIYEVHPEVSFVAMGTPPTYSKKTWRGFTERRQLLADQGIRLPDDLGAANIVSVDDILDAAAAAWSAHRIATGTASRLPLAAQKNERGQDLAIWY